MGRVGQETYQKQKMRKKRRLAWKREQDDLLGKENRTEERTCKAGDSDVMSARRESDRIGKGVRYPKERD